MSTIPRTAPVIAARVMTSAARRGLRRSRLMQIALIPAIWWAASGVVHVLALPVPAGIVGMAFALMLLATHRMSLFMLRRGAEWFVGEMMLFFVPAVVSVLDHPEFVGRLGATLLLLVVLSTLSVMTVTAFTVELFYRWSTRHVRP
jgi:holin-like protein